MRKLPNFPQPCDLCPHCRNPMAWIPEGGYPGWTEGMVWVFCIGEGACGHSTRFWLQKSYDTSERSPDPATLIKLCDYPKDK